MLFGREIIFEVGLFQHVITVPERYRQTDRQTDRQLTVASSQNKLMSDDTVRQ